MTNINEKFFIKISSKIGDIIDSLNSKGLFIDMGRLENHIEDCNRIIENSSKLFNVEVAKRGESIDITSRKEVIKWFFTILGLPVIKSGKTGPSLDSDTRESLIDAHPTMKYYSDVIEAKARLKTLNNIKSAMVDGILPVHYELNGTSSGRFTSYGIEGSKVSMNLIPKDIRDVFKPFSPTQVIVSFDYKNMDGCVGYNLSGQIDKLDEIAMGGDLHQNLADKLGITRRHAKILTHGISYGMTPFGISRKIGCSEEEAKNLVESYWKIHDKVKEFKEQTIHTARMFGYVSTISDFRRPVKGLSDDAIYSTQIQGSAADLFKQAILDVNKYLSESSSGSILTIQHDAIVCSLEEDLLEESIPKIVQLMRNVHENFRLFVDVEIGGW